jgi:hypothetical protein
VDLISSKQNKLSSFIDRYMLFLPDFLQSTLGHIINAKNSIKINGWNHHTKDKKARQKRPKDMQPARTKERRELVPLVVVGSCFIHSPCNVTHT